jgi:hypothetical protein
MQNKQQQQNNQKKKAGGLAREVECLSRKYKAWSSNLISPEKQNKIRKLIIGENFLNVSVAFLSSILLPQRYSKCI